MSPVATLRVALAASLLGCAGLFAYSQTRAVDHPRAAAYTRNLRQLKALDAHLNEEILRSRSGLVLHYDAIVSYARELRLLIDASRDVPHFLSQERAAIVSDRLTRVSLALDEKESLLETFKSQNAVVRNSQHFLPVATRTLAARTTSGTAIDYQLERLLSSLLELQTVPVVPQRLDGAIEDLAALGAASSDASLRDDIRVLIRHATLVRGRLPVVNELVNKLLSLSIAARVSDVEEVFAASLRMAEGGDSARQRLVYALGTIVVVLGLTDVILRLRQGRSALERASLELQRANLALAKEREKEHEIGEMKTRFVSMLSHELRTPLSAVRSSGELLERYGERWDIARREGHLDQIKRAAEAMGNMLDEILLIGRAEAGMLQPVPAPLNLPELCQEIVETLTRATQGSHVVRQHLGGDGNVLLDERLLRYLLSNLLENAMKYSSPGTTVDLEVGTTPNEVRLAIVDRGIGIPAEDLPHLFASFRRGANVGKVKGSGLGLAVVKHVVDAQGGTVDVRSVVGQGTEVTVSLPRIPGCGEAVSREAS